MMRFYKRQQGLTFLSLLLLLAVIGFFAYSAIKLTPIYLEYFNVSTSLKSLATEESQGLPASELKASLWKRLEINNVNHVTADDIKVKTEAGATTVSVAYEVREPFYGNVSLLVNFNDSVTLTGN